MTIYADQLRCPRAAGTGRCLHPAPRGISARIVERRWRRALARFLERPLSDEEQKYLKGSEPFHWFQRQTALGKPICMDSPDLDDGTCIRGGAMLEAWFFAAFDRGRGESTPRPYRTQRQAAAVARLRKKVARGGIPAPAFAERVAPARTVRPQGIRTGSPQDESDLGPARGRGAHPQ